MADEEVAAALTAAKQGDEDALAVVYRALQPGLLRYLRQRAAGVAEDLASETWLAAAGRLATFDGGIDAFRTWLFTVARNKVTDHYRTAGRRPATQSWDGGPGVPEPAPGADTADPADLVAASMDSQAAVAALVRDLSAEQAEVVLLRVVAGLDVTETAAVMGRSPGAVRVLQHRALRRLARIRAAEAAGPEDVRGGV
jgi:RNA polymerase sigma-70 factor (ECF subfamily)